MKRPKPRSRCRCRAGCAPYGPSIFVGREFERDVLSRALTGTTVSGRRAAFVTGEAGIGKTRLVSELASEAHAAGTLVLGGRCDEGIDVPYQPFVEALGHYVGHANEGVLHNYVDAYGGSLVRLVPELATRLSEPLPVASEPSEAERLRAVRSDRGAAADGIHRAPDVAGARGSPLGGRADDQGAPAAADLDPAFAVDGALHVPSHGARRRPSPASAARRRLPRSRTCCGSTWPDSRPATVAQLVRAMTDGLPAGADEELARALKTSTNGNAFFVTELLLSLVESGTLTDEQRPLARNRRARASRSPAGEHQRDARAARPALGRSRSSAVSSVAAVIGAEFDLDLVAARFGGGRCG